MVSSRMRLPDQPAQEWTAIKCGRLLRHLSLSICTLRKALDNKRVSMPAKLEAPTVRRLFEAKRKVPDGENKVTSTKRKKIRRTYSLRHAGDPKSTATQASSHSRVITAGLTSGHRTSSSVQNINLETPVVRRLSGFSSTPLSVTSSVGQRKSSYESRSSGKCWHLHDPSNTRTRDKCHANHCAINAERVRLQKDTPLGMLEHYDAIYQHLDALIRASSMQALDTAAPRSLLAMCLRKVPEFIIEEQYWDQKEHEENGTRPSFGDADVAAQVYWDLESTYGISERGWKQLAVVVQSHGIKMVKEAIDEGLIARPWALLLARLGDQAKGLADRTQLLEAALLCQKNEGGLDAHRVEKELDPSAHSIQYAVPEWADTDLAIAMMGKLLVQQSPSHTYIMSPGFGELWSSAITDLTSHCPSYGTTSLLIESLRILGGLGALGRAFSTPHPLARAKQSYLEALSVLTTMSIMGRNTLMTDISSDRHDRITSICKRVEYVLRSSIARMGQSPTIGVRRNTYFIQLAMFYAKGLVAEPTEDDDMLLGNFWAALKLRPEINDHLYGGAVALIPTIARTCCRRQTADQPRDLLSKLFDRLEDASPHGAPLYKMRIESAFYLAELTGDARDLIHAERLAQTTSEDIGRSLHTPARSRAFAGFRWDEGISEWVTATPLVTHRKSARRSSAVGDMEDNIPRTPVNNASPEDIWSTPEASTPERTITAVNKKSPERRKTARRSSRILSVPQLDVSSDESGELDELSFSLSRRETEKENRAPVAKHKSTKIARAMKRTQSRRSLLNTQLLSQVSTRDDHASSDDELSIM